MSTVSPPRALRVRPPAVAGFFYPGEPDALRGAVRKYLAEADAKIPSRAGAVPKAVIAPHAGYVYSGLTAAAAYRTLVPARGTITRVVMMGPCHRVAVSGLALPSADAFRTPLGEIALDKEAIARIAGLPGVEVFDATHKDDHALEVHLPFLQVVLGEFKIVPMMLSSTRTWSGGAALLLLSAAATRLLLNVKGVFCSRYSVRTEVFCHGASTETKKPAALPLPVARASIGAPSRISVSPSVWSARSIARARASPARVSIGRRCV